MSSHSDLDESGAERPPSLFKRLSGYLRGRNAEIRNSIEEAIEESDRESTQLSDQERGMLANLLRFGELRVDDVMVPRADIIAVEEKTPLNALIALFREAQHSRLPVYRETLDEVLGLVLLKDVVGLIEEGEGSFRWREKPLRELCRSVLFVPPSMPLRDLLLKMQSTHTHLALVIDEYGGTDGLITIEDVIEEIVGDIEDEHDEEVEQICVQDDGSFLADARTDLEDFNELAGVTLNEEEDGLEEVDTLGGLVVSLLGRVPQRGEIVRHPLGYEFEVLEADPRRVKRLLITPPKTPAQRIESSAKD